MKRGDQSSCLRFAVFAMLMIGVCRSASGFGKSDDAGSGSAQPYEVGDIIVFGPAGTSIAKCGHSAMLHCQYMDAGIWIDRVIDAMPPNECGSRGVTVNL